MYILTLNFSNQASIIGFHPRFLKTWLYWNKCIVIDNFIVNVIVQATSTFINLNFNSFIETNYSNFIHCCLIFYCAEKEKKHMCCGRAFTKQYTSQCIHLAQKGHPLCKSYSHSTSLHWERVPDVPCHGWHLAILVNHGHQKYYQKNQQHSCPSLCLLTFSSSYKIFLIRNIITLLLYPIFLKKIDNTSHIQEPTQYFKTCKYASIIHAAN
jgi:hypothetical protein